MNMIGGSAIILSIMLILSDVTCVFAHRHVGL
jgi:hypothetical protein